MFHRVFIFLAVTSLSTLSPAMAENDRSPAQIKNLGNKKIDWGLMLEASYSNIDLTDEGDANVGVFEELKRVNFGVTLMKPLGSFEPLVSIDFTNYDVEGGVNNTKEDRRLSFSVGSLFNLTSHKKSIVPFLEARFGYYKRTEKLKLASPVVDITYDGFYWVAGIGVKLFPLKISNIALVGKLYYEDTIGHEIQSSGRVGDISTNGVGVSLGFLLYL